MSRLIVGFVFGLCLLGLTLKCPAAWSDIELLAQQPDILAVAKESDSSKNDQPVDDGQEENQPSEETGDQTSETDEAAGNEDEQDGEEADTEEEASSDSEDKEKEADDSKESVDKENGDKKDEAAKKSDSSKDEPDAEKLKPHKVERKPLKIEATLDGLFAARNMQEVALRPEVWTQFKVIEAVEHGTRVKKGDVLVRFEDEKIEAKLAEESLSLQLGELALMREEEEFPRVEKALDLSYEQAKRAHDRLAEDHKYYQETERPTSIKLTEFMIKRAQESLAMQREELDQLEKMYEADELTEETEEIVLRRQRFQVEMAELILDLESIRRDYSLNVQLPRQDESFVTSLEETDLAFKQAKTSKNMGLTRKRYELEKQRNGRVRSVEQHAKLMSDRALMVLHAPTDGIVYYGRCVQGKWGEIASLTTKLRAHGSVAANTVVMTVVQQRPLYVETKLTEKVLPDFKEGLAATVVPGADDKLELSGKITEISVIPGSDKKFAMQLDVDTTSAPKWLVAGMTCKSKITVYENKEAIVIPSDLIQTDDEDEKMKYVMLVDPDEDEPVRRNVKLGRRKEKTVEILKGLDEGDEIVKESKKEK